MRHSPARVRWERCWRYVRHDRATSSGDCVVDLTDGHGLIYGWHDLVRWDCVAIVALAYECLAERDKAPATPAGSPSTSTAASMATPSSRCRGGRSQAAGST